VADDLARTRERLALEVTGGAGEYVAALVDQTYADDVHAVERTLQRLRAQLVTSREAKDGIDATRDVRLRVEWVGWRLLFVMGARS
jgi:hypothetical protein